MAKADAARNYYADLKISASASENEIRKAFRTLALQYHPDRNPGREAEFVVKFQEIQAAHEVLGDPTQRAKYDAERRKYRHLNVPTNASNTQRTRPPPPPRDAHTTSTASGSYYRAPPPKPYQQPFQQPPPPPPPPPPRPPPPPHHSTYTTGADRFTGKNFRSPPTAQRPDARDKGADARANVFTAWQKMKQPRAEETRPQGSGAQQHNPNGQPFGRSHSTRVPSSSSRRGFDPGTPGADEGQARSAYRSSYARPAQTPPSPMRDAQNNEVPYSEANRTRTPYYSNAAGERTSMFESINRSASVRNSPNHSHRPSPSAEAGSYSDSGRRQQRNSYSGKSTKPFPFPYPDSSDEESEPDVIHTSTKHRGPPPPPPPPPQKSQPAWSQGAFCTPQPSRQTSGGPGNAPNPFKSRSEESINMKFSPSDWHGKFEGSADYFAPNIPKAPSMPKASNNKGRTSPTRSKPSHRPAPEKTPSSSQPTNPPPVSTFSQPYFPPPPPGPPPKASFFPSSESAAAAAAAAHPTTFSPQAWKESFKEASWVLGAEPRRASESTKRQKAARKSSVPHSSGSKPQDQADPSRTKYQAFTEDADAMDIDSSTPPAPSRNPSNSRTQATPTTVPVSKGSAQTPSFVAAALPGFSPSGATKETVEPFVSTQNGGLDMGDLGDSLPHKSQASSAHPTKPSSAQSLKFPDIPAAPRPPSKLDRESTDVYFIQFERYVKSYMQLSKAIATHFNARNVQLQDLDDHFVRSRGETTKKLGFASYMDRMREDEAVITTWGVAQGKHIQALGQCEEVRNKTIKLYLPQS
ncbi:hypothetical protein P153DRAFT_337839 [Dothidotthia symphoricarpi CBS 119687]|uniref:J domain-containing protein n=1 Tax=Dothidotthia symphoricarpi CBS 119687 TaxID=1392245 RepID=A0A6A6AFC3_9PLEO|nr:uncharacterized protein P153DRAFT_337839 [Dothidotthia symphoricarpi CBS 119687]KAF2130256.1 hypothetical protein P153DRAFT_337839 [Dothidotthia symphoricarpi CBS 119687]